MLGIGHMIPSSLEAMNKMGYNHMYTYYSILVGYALILFIEKIAFDTSELIHADDQMKIATIKQGKQSNHK